MALAQLTLEVGDELGVELGVEHMTGSYRIGGELPCAKELKKGAGVHVVVTDSDGEVISSVYGRVAAISFVDHEKDGLQWTERAHRIKPVVPS